MERVHLDASGTEGALLTERCQQGSAAAALHPAFPAVYTAGQTIWTRRVSNFPLSYKLSWLPRFLRPSLAGDARGFAPAAATLMPSPARTVRLAFVGDISAVANRTAPAIDPAISRLLASADLVVGNCESPVVARPAARIGTWLGTRHAMTEDFLARTLDAAGVARERLALSVANNHALDQGVEGLEETCASLGKLGVRVVGTVPDEPFARVPAGPLTVGLAAFTLWRNAGEAEFAGRVAMDAEKARRPAAAQVDLLCALPHWDWEFCHFPRAGTRALARRLAEHGAGLIVGGHAHVVQPVERIAGTLVAYGLGDFLGTALARQPWPGRIGAILIVEVSADAGTRGSVSSYRTHFFYRLREGGRERLVPLEALTGATRDRAMSRLGAVFGGV